MLLANISFIITTSLSLLHYCLITTIVTITAFLHYAIMISISTKNSILNICFLSSFPIQTCKEWNKLLRSVVLNKTLVRQNHYTMS